LDSRVWISGYTTIPHDFDSILHEVQEKYPAVSLQFVDLDRVPGSRYLFVAALNALESFRSKQSISKTLSMEILLYVSASRQIAEAIRLVGISSDTKRIAALSVGKTKEELSGTAALLNQVLAQTNSDALVDDWSTARIENVGSLFRIESRELNAIIRKGESKSQAVERLAMERSALLTVRK
jgi:tRNA threonylcarbamoyladenosine modification (KEOPS) complex Cgi121 subunit